MKIRVRLTLWYAGIMFVSLFLMGVLAYRQFAPESHEHKSPEEEAADESDFHESLSTLLWCGIPAAVLALGGGWWLMRRALTPVTALTAAAAEINEGNLRRQLPRSGNGDELDRLTEVFNAMTTRLDTSFQRVREFTLHASHELKTPLTVMHAELETALVEERLTPQARERLLSQLDEVRRLSTIVDVLTLLTKADAGQVRLASEPVAFDEVVRDVFADAQTLAHNAGLELKMSACEAASVRGDRHRLRQLLLNLADNSIKYNAPRGSVEFALHRNHHSAEFSIANTGPGIPKDQLSRVFERFFRGDPSHNNAVDGCGLGLSIAQWIVSAHSGEIQMESEPGKMTTVTVRLPLSKVSN